MKFTTPILALLATTASAFIAQPNGSGKASTALFKKSPGLVSQTAGWDMKKISPNVRIEGQSRHTFSFQDPSKEIVQIAMHSPNGRPLNSDVELYIGPDWTPLKVHCHTEDGTQYPLQTLVGTRNKFSNIEILNTGAPSFPIEAACSYAIEPLASARESIQEEDGFYIEGGGAIKMYPISAAVDELQVLITTEGKMLNAVIELLNGPNNVKVQYEVFTNNGQLNSLFVVFECPKDGNSLRIRNLAPLEFPAKFYVRPTKFGSNDTGPIIR
jgi:hypothetical protein